MLWRRREEPVTIVPDPDIPASWNRLERWQYLVRVPAVYHDGPQVGISGFHYSHGTPDVSDCDDALHLVAPDGCCSTVTRACPQGLVFQIVFIKPNVPDFKDCRRLYRRRFTSSIAALSDKASGLF